MALTVQTAPEIMAGIQLKSGYEQNPLQERTEGDNFPSILNRLLHSDEGGAETGRIEGGAGDRSATESERFSKQQSCETERETKCETECETECETKKVESAQALSSERTEESKKNGKNGAKRIAERFIKTPSQKREGLTTVDSGRNSMRKDRSRTGRVAESVQEAQEKGKGARLEEKGIVAVQKSCRKDEAVRVQAEKRVDDASEGEERRKATIPGCDASLQKTTAGQQGLPDTGRDDSIDQEATALSASLSASRSAKVGTQAEIRSGHKKTDTGRSAAVVEETTLSPDDNAGGRVNQAKIVVVDLRSPKENRPKIGIKNSNADEKRAEISEVKPAGDTDLRVMVRPAVRAGIQPDQQLFGRRGIAGQLNRPSFERFRETLRNEVVRHSSIVLRNEGKGELRLILKPESLGHVRVKLNLNNNHIEGRIIVENNTVKGLFDSNMHDLSNAFAREGFSSASLEVFVGHDNSGGRQRESDVPAGEALSRFEESVPAGDLYESEDRLINLTA